ncbi:MAG TPA: hypothetical protein VN682_04785 [Terriglobales bacterium]|nr:hypothetical protein [Terriglobales bacterium]
MRRHEQSGNLQVEHRRAWALAVVLGASLWPAISLAQENAPAATGATQTENTTPAQPTERIKHGYAVHETADLGGHIASIDGSGAMYNTLVNVHPGPRVLGQTFELRAVEGSKHLLFDNLNAFTTGFGGDPNNVATLRFSKGKSYDFDGLFRRDRQYFDYNLLANPLVPSALVSNGYTFPQLIDSPHMFNTVRRMTDVNLTILPLEKVTGRIGYSQVISQGPTLSSVHEGTEGLLLQNWRFSTDTYLVAADWKPLTKTKVTFEEHITHYKGNTSDQIAPQALNLQLSNATPVSLGYDNITVPGNTSASSPCGNNPAIISSTTNPPTANACENGFLQYFRYQPSRTIWPTEELRFQSGSVKHLALNGRINYTGANMKMPNYYEYFNGLGRSGLRIQTITGNSRAERVSVAADFGAVWELSNRVSLLEQYDYVNFRQPGYNDFFTTNQSTTTAAASMLNNPTITAGPTTAVSNTFLGQKSDTNNLTLEWEANAKATLSLGYRYRGRTVRVNENGTPFTVLIHENGGNFGVVLRPSPQWRVNGTIEVMYADNAFIQIAPRARQRYNLRASYRPKDWATVALTLNDQERRDNVALVNHLDHSRSFTAGATIAPNERYGLDLSYGYTDFFTQSTECYYSTSGGPPVPPGTNCGTNTILSHFYYDAPTQYGSFAFMLQPTKQVRTSVGYRISSADGNTVYDNPRQVPGALDSQYMSPFASAAWTVHPGWIWRGEWNYYGYGESGAIGPTSPRAFHSNVVTIAMHYEF